MVGLIFHIAHPGIHLTGQHFDFLGQLLYLSRHHGETPALNAGPGRFNGGIDGQNIRLIRNGHNLAHTLLDLSDGGLQLREGLCHLMVGLLHLRGGLTQLLHLLLGL